MGVGTGKCFKKVVGLLVWLGLAVGTNDAWVDEMHAWWMRLGPRSKWCKWVGLEVRM